MGNCGAHLVLVGSGGDLPLFESQQASYSLGCSRRICRLFFGVSANEHPADFTSSFGCRSHIHEGNNTRSQEGVEALPPVAPTVTFMAPPGSTRLRPLVMAWRL